MTETEPPARLPNPRRVTFQPVMAAGLDGTELILTISLGFAAFLVTAGVALPVLGAPHLALLAGGVAGGASGLALRAAIVRARRQRPEGYPLQLALRLRHDLDPVPGLVAGEGLWDPLRHDR